jgi:CBS domain-containing protein
MDREIIDDEIRQMYEESGSPPKILDESTIKVPIRNLPLHKPILLEEGSSVAQALDLMKKNRIGCMLVVRNGKLTGIFTERDVLMKIVGTPLDLSTTPIETLMTRNPDCLQPDDMIAFALNRMHIGGFRHIPLVDENHKPVGIVSVKDIVDYLVDHFSEEVLNLPPNPIRVTTEREGA